MANFTSSSTGKKVILRTLHEDYHHLVEPLQSLFPHSANVKCKCEMPMHLSMSNPRGGWGGGGLSKKSREFDCDLNSQVADFDQTSCIWSFNFIDKSRREAIHLFLLILTIFFARGWGFWNFFLENVKIPTLCLTPPPPPPQSGLTLIGA